MVKANSVVLYKNTAAVILGCQPSQKFEIKFRTQNATQTKAAVYSTQSVRQKDFIILSENPCSSLENVLKFQEDNSPKEEDSYKLDSDNSLTAAIRESWELLLSDEESAGQEISFEELARNGNGNPVYVFWNVPVAEHFTRMLLHILHVIVFGRVSLLCLIINIDQLEEHHVQTVFL